MSCAVRGEGEEPLFWSGAGVTLGSWRCDWGRVGEGAQCCLLNLPWGPWAVLQGSWRLGACACGLAGSGPAAAVVGLTPSSGLRLDGTLPVPVTGGCSSGAQRGACLCHPTTTGGVSVVQAGSGYC